MISDFREGGQVFKNWRPQCKKAFSIGEKSEIGGGGVKNGPKISDIIYGRPLIYIFSIFQEPKAKDTGTNDYANLVEECYGLDKIEFLQSHENLDIYRKAFDIIERYFGSEEDDSRIAPSVDAQVSSTSFERSQKIKELIQLCSQ